MECAFGEIDRRWGILWKRLEFTLVKSTRVIDACMRLHNFIINYRERTGTGASTRRELRMESELFDEDSLNFVRRHPNELIGVFGNAHCGHGGRPTNTEKEMRDTGV